MNEKEQRKPLQLSLNLQYGISREQACILCHLSAECSGCCQNCDKGCQGQMCGQPFRDYDGQRWDTWMYLVTHQLRRLLMYIPKEQRKKYGIK